MYPFHTESGYFSTAASVLDPEASEFELEPLKWCFSVCHRLLDLLGVSHHWFSKTGTFRVWVLGADLDQQLCLPPGKLSECSILTFSRDPPNMGFKVFLFVYQMGHSEI